MSVCYIGILADEGSAHGGGPGFAGLEDSGGGFFLPLGGTAFGAGQAVPGFDAHELGHAGLRPDQCVGELPDVADNAAVSPTP